MTEGRYAIEDYESADGNWLWCVTDSTQTGSDGFPLIVGRFPNHEAASVALDTFEGMTGAIHYPDCDMDEDCTCGAS